jgi:uncharacterized protein
MSQLQLELLPIRFDPQNYADNATELHGQIVTKSMTRLTRSVVSIEPMVTGRFWFSRGLYGYPHVMGEVEVKVTLQCERCLDVIEINLKPHINVLIKPKTDRLPENSEFQDGPEFYEFSGKYLTLSDLVEEELLLAIPIFPRHEDISLCNQDMVAWLASNEATEKASKTENNPFAILKR